MKKKFFLLNEKLSITISSSIHAHRNPFRFDIRKLFVFSIAFAVLVLFVGSVCLSIRSLDTIHTLEANAQSLETTLHEQQELIEQKSDDMKRMEQHQQVLEEKIGTLLLRDMDNSSDEDDDPLVSGVVSGSAPTSVDTTTLLQQTQYTNGSINSRVELIDWFNGGSETFSRYMQAVVIDVQTGLSFNIRRFGGKFHADSEPLTPDDTAVMKTIYGGEWSWDRRAIWVKIGDRYIAASMNGMPHMVDPTPSNNFDGHFCVHFLNSKVHATSNACQRHQERVMEAFTNADMLDEYLKINQY